MKHSSTGTTNTIRADFLRNKFSWLTAQKTANFAEFLFAIELFIVDFAAFIFVVGRFERLHEEWGVRGGVGGERGGGG